MSCFNIAPSFPLTSSRWYLFLVVWLSLLHIAYGATLTPSSIVYVLVSEVNPFVSLGQLEGLILEGRLAEVGDTRPAAPELSFSSTSKYSLLVDFSGDDIVEKTARSVHMTVDGMSVFKSNLEKRPSPLEKLWRSLFWSQKPHRLYAHFTVPFTPIHTKSNNTNIRQLHSFRVTAYKSTDGKGEILGFGVMEFYTVPDNTTAST